jgi:hypothetical protein
MYAVKVSTKTRKKLHKILLLPETISESFFFYENLENEM